MKRPDKTAAGMTATAFCWVFSDEEEPLRWALTGRDAYDITDIVKYRHTLPKGPLL